MTMRNVFNPSLNDTYLTAKLSFRGTNMATVMRKHFVTLKGFLVKKFISSLSGYTTVALSHKTGRKKPLMGVDIYIYIYIF